MENIIFDKVVKALSKTKRRVTIISTPPQWNGDRHSIEVIIGMNQDDNFIDEIHDALDGIKKIGNGYEVGICGLTSCYDAMSYTSIIKMNGGFCNSGNEYILG